MAIAKKQTSADKKNSSLSEPKTETAMQGEDYCQMVSEAAYYRAEKRDFVYGNEMEDWVAAEAESN